MISPNHRVHAVLPLLAPTGRGGKIGGNTMFCEFPFFLSCWFAVSYDFCFGGFSVSLQNCSSISAVFHEFPQRNLGLKCPDEYLDFCQNFAPFAERKKRIFTNNFCDFRRVSTKKFGFKMSRWGFDFCQTLPLLPSEKNEFLLTIFAIFGVFPQRNLGLKCFDEASFFAKLCHFSQAKNGLFSRLFGIFCSENCGLKSIFSKNFARQFLQFSKRFHEEIWV